MPDDFVYLDVLPLRSAEDVGGFSLAATRRRGVAYAVTMDGAGRFRVFRRGECAELVAYLRTAGCVVGYHLDFDFDLVRGEVPFKRPRCLDLLTMVAESAGRRLSVRSAVRRTLGKVPVPDPFATQRAAAAGDWTKVEGAMKRKLRLFARLHDHLLQHGLSEDEQE
jgi:hypothetical protein